MADAQQGKRKIERSVAKHPRKRMYRARAHSNPLNDTTFEVPLTPDQVPWAAHFPSFFPRPAEASTSGASPSGAAAEQPLVRFADVGCGFGGLLVRLSPLYPDTLMVGLELRDKVSAYVRERCLALRREHAGQYENITCMRLNAMKHLPNLFRKEQLTKLFFLFPDPHFKVANHRRRIINTGLITEYAYVLAPGGMLYTISDVPELGQWMRAKLDAHPMFERIDDAQLADDPAANLLTAASEEAQKVARNGGQTFRNVYRRLQAPRTIAPPALAVMAQP